MLLTKVRIIVVGPWKLVIASHLFWVVISQTSMTIVWLLTIEKDVLTCINSVVEDQFLDMEMQPQIKFHFVRLLQNLVIGSIVLWVVDEVNYHMVLLFSLHVIEEWFTPICLFNFLDLFKFYKNIKIKIEFMELYYISIYNIFTQKR